MTPYELSLVVDAFMETKKQQEEREVTLLWIGEAWRRTERLPSLEKVLNQLKEKPKDKAPQKPETMLDIIKALNSKFGGNTY